MVRHALARRGVLALGFLCACPDGKTTTVDADGDGVDEDTDCNDGDPEISPGAVDICGDGIDSDCDGIDPVCNNDADGDGFDADDDCDDGNDAVYPGAFESCTDDVDNDCDGISTTCLGPTLIYEATTIGPVDPYGTAVFADRILFGDPSGGTGVTIGDGRVVAFELQEGTVSELDAVFVGAGEVGGNGTFGIVLEPYDDMLCIGADYTDAGASTDAGRAWCFTDATIAAASTSLALASAQYDVAGSATQAFVKVLGEEDVDGDGLFDLVAYSADGLYVTYGGGAPWSGGYSVPADADLTIGDCASDPGYWCGFSSAISNVAIAASGPGGSADPISIYRLPITTAPPVPDATYVMDRNVDDSMTAVATFDGFAIGSTIGNEVHFVDSDGNVLEILGDSLGEGFGYVVDAFVDHDGHEQLLVGALTMTTDGDPRGGVYVFDLTEHGLPTSTSQAEYVLTAPLGYEHCGLRTRGGTIVDEYTSNTVVSVSCYGHGGLAYVLDTTDLPPPPIPPAHIQQTGANAWSIKSSAIQPYVDNPAWISTLAQTRQVTQDGEILGWRLLGITTGSPLYRAGLRSGDLVKRVNNVAVTTPAVVRQIAASLVGAASFTMRIQRAGATRTITYSIVP